MHRLLLAFLLLFSVQTAWAQDSNDKVLNTIQPCGDALSLFEMATRQGEKLLFSANGITLLPTTQTVNHGAFFFVNQDTGNWTLINVFGDGTGCLGGAGKSFSPNGN